MDDTLRSTPDGIYQEGGCDERPHSAHRQRRACPAVIYAATVALYLAKRRYLPANGKFDLGAWEKPVLVVSVVWLVFELSLFRDASFRDAWLYVLVMVVIGAAYLVTLPATRGRRALDMPDMHSIDGAFAQKEQI
ncbi:hypothetical protein AB0J35_26655 [Nonomuraea angiospora]|uniref:hypothetical protein n=1 Tax=Nonomuraea angiospora TaxID=46172 RepID=UPI00342CB32B